MTITIAKKDLFTVPQGYYLAHCISADFALGAGIAKVFDEVYNMRFKLFSEYDAYSYEGGDAVISIHPNIKNLPGHVYGPGDWFMHSYHQAI